MRGSRQLSERRSAPWYGRADANPNQQSRRDLRLDLFRGLSLFFIFIDPIPNNVLSYVRLHSIAFSDAAEASLFISACACATGCGRAVESQVRRAAAGHIYRRIWQHYVPHVFIFVILAAEVCSATHNLQKQAYSEHFGIDNFIDEPQVAIIKGLLL